MRCWARAGARSVNRRCRRRAGPSHRLQVRPDQVVDEARCFGIQLVALCAHFVKLLRRERLVARQAGGWDGQVVGGAAREHFAEAILGLADDRDRVANAHTSGQAGVGGNQTTNQRPHGDNVGDEAIDGLYGGLGDVV